MTLCDVMLCDIVLLLSFHSIGGDDTLSEVTTVPSKSACPLVFRGMWTNFSNFYEQKKLVSLNSTPQKIRSKTAPIRNTI